MALKAMERAQSLNFTNAAFWNDWGRMLEKTNRFDDALQAYAKAVEEAEARLVEDRAIWARTHAKQCALEIVTEVAEKVRRVAAAA